MDAIEKTENQIRAELKQHIGTGGYFRTMAPNVIYTDGVKHMADICGAYWFIDLIVSHQVDRISMAKIPDRSWQSWRLIVTGDTAIATCGDGNGNDVIMQEIEFTDFPLKDINIWAIDGGKYITIMLPSEY